MTRSDATSAIDQLTLTTSAPQRTAIGSAPTVVKPMSGGYMTTDRASRMHTDTEYVTWPVVCLRWPLWAMCVSA